MLERRQAWSFQHDDRSAASHQPPADAPPGARGLRRKDAARALCAAGKALAGRACRARQLAEALGTIGVPAAQRKMRVQQLWHWLYVRGATRFDEMTSVSKELRAVLDAHFTLARPEVVAEQVSVDGTRKWLLRLPGEHAGERPHEVECVYIPGGRPRHALRLEPGRLHAHLLVLPYRHAAAGAQPHAGRDRRPDHGRARPPRRLAGRRAAPKAAAGGARCVSNIVMMGMGEPLYNFEAVRDALLIAADGEGIAISKRRITLSTSGVVPNIARAGAEIGCMLAVSLHAVRDELRNELVPLNRKYPIAGAARRLPQLSRRLQRAAHHLRIRDAQGRQRFARRRQGAGASCSRAFRPRSTSSRSIPGPGTAYECSDWEQIEKFSEIIFNAGYASPVRTPRGRDILAACGQLKSATEKLSARERLALRAMAMTD